MTLAEANAYTLSVVLSIVLVAGGACASLMLEALFSSRRGGANPLLSGSRLGIVLAAVATISLGFAMWHSAVVFSDDLRATFQLAQPMLRLDRFSSLGTGLLGMAAILSVWMSITYLQALHINHGEYYALLLLSTAGMFVVVSAVNLMGLFLGMELMSLPLYALAGFDRRKLRGNEAALKLYLTGAFATAVMLYGAALVYGSTGHVDYAGIRVALDVTDPIAMAGLGLLIAGFGFKLSAPPFHQWTPDTYEGAPAPVTAFLSVGAKTAAFLVLLRFLIMALPELAVEKLQGVFAGLAVLAMVVGSLMAILQTNVKRMLGYASIAQAGILLIALVAGTREAYTASLFFLFVTILMNLGAFTVIVTLARGGHERERVDDYSGLARTRPGLAAAMALFMLSIVGLPGTAGFAAKFELFAAAVNADQVGIVVVGVFASVISLVYCLRLPMVMYMREPGEERPGELASNEFLVLTLCALGVVYFGFFFDLSIFEAAIRGLRF